jgi:hypothetical protein
MSTNETQQGDKSASERRVTACLGMTDRKLGRQWTTIPDWELIGTRQVDGGFRFHDAAIQSRADLANKTAKAESKRRLSGCAERQNKQSWSVRQWRIECLGGLVWWTKPIGMLQ